MLNYYKLERLSILCLCYDDNTDKIVAFDFQSQ